MTQTLAPPRPTPAVPSADAATDRTIRAFVEHGGQLSEAIVELAGHMTEVRSAVETQVSELGHVETSVGRIAGEAKEIAEAAHVSQEAMSSARSALDASQARMHTTSGKVEALVHSAEAVSNVLETSNETIAEVARVTARIDKIADRTHMLALNATIQAARAGAAGRAFAVVADEVKGLAQQTQEATQIISQIVGRLVQSLEAVADRSLDAKEHAYAVEAETRPMQEALTSAVAELAEADRRAQRIGEGAASVAGAVQELGASIEVLGRDAEKASTGIAGATEQANGLIARSEDLGRLFVRAHIETPDTPYVQLAQEGAAFVSAAFEAALASGQITSPDLFDRKLSPIAGTNPQQHMARYTELCDQRLQRFQDELATRLPGVAFCAAVDDRGYLPTHNSQYSKKPTQDPVYDAANCRNRRVFGDRVGLAAGKNTTGPLVQTYRRDMGGGTFVLMKDVSAPIFVKGRHWGGFRIGYRLPKSPDGVRR